MNTLLAELCSYLDLKPEHTALLHERDTSNIWRQFAIWLLVDEEYGVIRFTKPGTKQCEIILQFAELYIKDCKDKKLWDVAHAAYSYADDDAAFCPTAAAWYALSAAYGVAAGYAAHAAYRAARAAAYYYADDDDADAWSAATDAHYQRMEDKLIELINAAPLKETI